VITLDNVSADKTIRRYQMKPSEFKAWRKDCKLTQEQAAKKLGLKKRTIQYYEKGKQYYEKGKRDGKDFKIPKTTELACYAITVGVEHYFGPESLNDEDS
jgi:DNA-binding XRE family transcriptional regulator